MLDWLVREGGLILNWWLLVTLAGVAVWPLCVKLLGALPDKGYTLARPLGLLLVAYVFWLLGMFGLLRNTAGSILLAWGLVLLIGLIVYARVGLPFDWRAWWFENRTVVIAGELLFLALFFGWVLVRAHMNSLLFTEKPMELMFLNSVQRSPSFPPNDGWLSGFAISYYYFGYVMSSMFSTLSGITATTGFNLTISMWFALTGTTAFGVLYNLVRSRFSPGEGSRVPALLAGGLATLLVVFIGNFQTPLVEIPYHTGSAEAPYFEFWLQAERLAPRVEPVGIDVADWGNWWWFRASRVLTDRNLDGSLSGVSPIDEFPQFSFLLSDVHPHVLALPFVILTIGLAVNLLLAGRKPKPVELALYALAVGGLIFLNTWDAPVYLMVLVGADLLRRMVNDSSGRFTVYDLVQAVGTGIIIAVGGALLVLPFLVGFQSQASGFLPNLLNPTLPQQYFVMFGPFLLLLVPFLIARVERLGARVNWTLGMGLTLFLLLLLIFGFLGILAILWFVPELRDTVLRYVEEMGGWANIMPIIQQRRLETLATTVGLALLLVTTLAVMLPRGEETLEEKMSGTPDRWSLQLERPTGFALLLVVIAILMTLIPEFIYLRDNFGVRINTIFKFYYQAWVLFALGSAYGVYTVLNDERTSSALRVISGVLVAIVLTLGMIYPIAGIYHRTQIESGRAYAFDPAPLTLNGAAGFASGDDYAAITCISALTSGEIVTIAEATGPAYHEEYGRVAALTGQPVLLGWDNHERQWRGPTYSQTVGTRARDLQSLYNDPRWETARELLARYQVDYVFFGQTEHNDFGAVAEQKFRDNLPIVCEFGNSRFYQVIPSLLTVDPVANG